MRIFFLIILVIPLQANSEDKKLNIEIEKLLMAPCCWSGTVYDHGHDQMENEIEEFIKKEKSKDDILKYYSSIYGERILSSPKSEGLTIAVWLMPPLLALAALGYYFNFMKNNIRLPKPISTSAPNIPYDEDIEKELKEIN